MSAREKYDYIVLLTPIPVDVFGTLAVLVGDAWPGATVITDPFAAQVPEDVRRRLPGVFTGFGRQNYVLVRIPTNRAAKRLSKKKVRETVAEHEVDHGEPVFEFLGMSEDTVRLQPPEELAHWLGAAGHRIIEGFEGTVNFLEWEIVDRESEARTVLSVARSEGQTPGALRRAAEDKIARALARMEERERAQLDEHGALVEELRAILA